MSCLRPAALPDNFSRPTTRACPATPCVAPPGRPEEHAAASGGCRHRQLRPGGGAAAAGGGRQRAECRRRHRGEGHTTRVTAGDRDILVCAAHLTTTLHAAPCTRQPRGSAKRDLAVWVFPWLAAAAHVNPHAPQWETELHRVLCMLQLHVAARANHVAACRALVDGGADALRRNGKNRTPLSQLKVRGLAAGWQGWGARAGGQGGGRSWNQGAVGEGCCLRKHTMAVAVGPPRLPCMRLCVCCTPSSCCPCCFC